MATPTLPDTETMLKEAQGWKRPKAYRSPLYRKLEPVIDQLFSEGWSPKSMVDKFIERGWVAESDRDPTYRAIHRRVTKLKEGKA